MIEKKKEQKKLGQISENTNELDKFIKNIPKDYVKYFGNNISYFFKYLNLRNINLENFIKNEKNGNKKKYYNIFGK